ncbi:MAG: hypothetical protein QXI91_06140 [Candidatus Bathyarchaeia archaeon]
MRRFVYVFILVGIIAVALGCVLALTPRKSCSEGDQVEWFPVGAEKWVRVELIHWIDENGKSYINVTKIFADYSYNNVTWGNPVIEGNNITVNVKHWKTGGGAQMILTLRHTYDLGVLPSGNYTFTFKVWDTPVKSITFTVP